MPLCPPGCAAQRSAARHSSTLQISSSCSHRLASVEKSGLTMPMSGRPMARMRRLYTARKGQVKGGGGSCVHTWVAAALYASPARPPPLPPAAPTGSWHLAAIMSTVDLDHRTPQKHATVAFLPPPQKPRNVVISASLRWTPRVPLSPTPQFRRPDADTCSSPRFMGPGPRAACNWVFISRHVWGPSRALFGGQAAQSGPPPTAAPVPAASPLCSGMVALSC